MARRVEGAFMKRKRGIRTKRDRMYGSHKLCYTI